MGLEEKADAYVRTLSGGQKQRLSLGCALVGDPELLFLDEPTTGLDPQSRRQTWEIVEGLKARGRSVLLTTHYMEEAARLCDRVADRRSRQVIALGTPARARSPRWAPSTWSSSASTTPGARRRCADDVAERRGCARDGASWRLTVREVHRAVPALLVGADRARAGTDAPHDAPRDAGGRVHVADGTEVA